MKKEHQKLIALAVCGVVVIGLAMYGTNRISAFFKFWLQRLKEGLHLPGKASTEGTGLIITVIKPPADSIESEGYES